VAKKGDYERSARQQFVRLDTDKTKNKGHYEPEWIDYTFSSFICPDCDNEMNVIANACFCSECGNNFNLKPHWTEKEIFWNYIVERGKR